MGLDLISSELAERIARCLQEIEEFNSDDRLAIINHVKIRLHELSPMREEPVDCVLWVKGESVEANDYNPNSVAPPEMELLRVSISEDGYTQPIVVYGEKEKLVVVDGFHRNRVGKECPEVKKRLNGYLPVVIINEGRTDRGDRIASTIRHNRARGKHKISAMSEIVIELKRRNWSDEKIGKNLGIIHYWHTSRVPLAVVAEALTAVIVPSNVSLMLVDTVPDGHVIQFAVPAATAAGVEVVY